MDAMWTTTGSQARVAVAVLAVLHAGCGAAPGEPVEETDREDVPVTSVAYELKAGQSVVFTWIDPAGVEVPWTLGIDTRALPAASFSAKFGHPVDAPESIKGYVGMLRSGQAGRVAVAAYAGGTGVSESWQIGEGNGGTSRGAERSFVFAPENETWRMYLAVVETGDASLVMNIPAHVDVIEMGRFVALYASDLRGTGVAAGVASAHAEVDHPIDVVTSGWTAYAFWPTGYPDDPEVEVIGPDGAPRRDAGLTSETGQWRLRTDTMLHPAGSQRMSYLAITDLHPWE